jgi:hypothetical protein
MGIIEGITSMLSMIGIFGVIFYYIYTRHMERRYMLENNVGGNYFGENKKNTYSFWTLRIGLVVAGFFLGVIIGTQDWLEGKEEVYAFLFAAIGLIIAFIVEKRIIDRERESLAKAEK